MTLVFAQKLRNVIISLRHNCGFFQTLSNRVKHFSPATRSICLNAMNNNWNNLMKMILWAQRRRLQFTLDRQLQSLYKFIVIWVEVGAKVLETLSLDKSTVWETSQRNL